MRKLRGFSGMCAASGDGSPGEPARAAARAELRLSARAARRLLERSGRLRPREEVDVDAPDAPGAELDVAGPRAVVRVGCSPPLRLGDQVAATVRAAPSENTPALGTPTVATSPTAYTPGKQVSSVRESTGPSRPRPSRSRRRRRARGASARRGTGRRQLAAIVEHGDAARRVDRRSRGGRGRTRCPRSAKAASSAAGRLRRRRHRAPERHDERDLAVVAHAALPTDSRAGAAPPRSARAGT